MPGVFDDELLHQQGHEAVDIIRIDAEGDHQTAKHERAQVFGVASLRSVVTVTVALLEVRQPRVFVFHDCSLPRERETRVARAGASRA